jgi:hypothetical protein
MITASKRPDEIEMHFLQVYVNRYGEPLDPMEAASGDTSDFTLSPEAMDKITHMVTSLELCPLVPNYLEL